jgi:RecA-family ATPase
MIAGRTSEVTADAERRGSENAAPPGRRSDSKSPLEILMTEFLPQEQVEAIEKEVAKIQEPPGLKSLHELKSPVYGNDPDELFKYRFLYRRGLLLLCGPTGVGKSALLIQAAVHWAIGKEFFGIVPGDIYQKKGMRIVLIQAENDEGDLAEMRDGVKAGCDELTEAEKEAGLKRIMTRTVCDKSGDEFVAMLDVILQEKGPFDLVMVDPAFAYLGGDSNSQKDVSRFMRELLNPLLQKHQVGMVLAHHTNKPLRGKEKESWAAGDYAYLGGP